MNVIHTLPTIVLQERPARHFRIEYDGDHARPWSVFFEGIWLVQYTTFFRALSRLWKAVRNGE